jgi:hypothetical protein
MDKENEEQIYEKVNSEELKTTKYNLVVLWGREHFDEVEEIYLGSDIEPIKIGSREIEDSLREVVYEYYIIKRGEKTYLIEQSKEILLNYDETYYEYSIWKLPNGIINIPD